jgi:hypothetical protein
MISQPATDRESELETALSIAQMRIKEQQDQFHIELQAVTNQLAAARQDLARVAPQLDRLAELEKLLAPPPPDSGIVTVSYSDGRVKYAATNGDKFTTSAEASHRNMVLAIRKAADLTEAQAEMIVARKDTLVTALSA